MFFFLNILLAYCLEVLPCNTIVFLSYCITVSSFFSHLCVFCLCQILNSLIFTYLTLSLLMNSFTDISYFISDNSNYLTFLFLGAQYVEPCNSVATAINLKRFSCISFNVLFIRLPELYNISVKIY